ncbi:hypothetical protein BT93_L4695 [Corymbia citriodora subsp. variegata]|uniref:Uncharacterized protein n=1 Tax=Corymbia citriodora subsp. variegata TaxID=360336 RepID=A0A8T0CTT8_CORYI|nr:hypothetical protein BT93_L4695 [Corymbia citriodora subsp. variegata]
MTPRLGSLLRRFTSLKSIDLSSFHSDPSAVLLQIAQFPLPLEHLDLSNQKSLRFDGLREMGSKFGALRVLVLYNVGLRGDADLVSIVECFPALEELEIKYPMQDHRARVTDDGIYVLSRKLQRLSRINVSGNPFLTDQSLMVLSVNCPSLREVVFRGCGLITGRGVASLIVNRPHLVSLALSDMEEQAIFCEESFIWDGLLMAVAEANIPLKRLVFSHSSGFSFDGIQKIVLKHRGIDDLDLVAVDFLTDRHMRVICEGLRSLTYIDVSECSNLTMRTLCDLMRQCPFLEGIEMMMTGLRKDDANETDIVVNSRVRSLRISTNVNLTDECLKKIERMCRSLCHLEVGDCLKITEDGILGVLKSCPEIGHLYIHENLHAKDLKLNDEQLVAFISRCCNLKYLDLPNCVHLSTKGVEKVVKNCNRLREINLRDCHNVRDDVPFLDWMVSVRPSLRRIVPPRGVSSEIRDFLWQRGLSCRC